MRVIIEREIIEDSIASPEDFARMTDAEIVGLLMEDLASLLDGADVTVER